MDVCVWVCVCVCVSRLNGCSLSTLLNWRAHPPTLSSWPRVDASQKPLHSLTPLSPSSHGRARQNPAIVPPRTDSGAHMLANRRAHTHAHHAPPQHVQMGSEQQQFLPGPVEKP